MMFQIATRLWMASFDVHVQSLTDLWFAQSLTGHMPYHWKASPEAMWEIEALADYVDALAHSGTDFHLLIALGVPATPGSPIPDSVFANHAAFLRYLRTADLHAKQLPVTLGCVQSLAGECAQRKKQARL